MIAIPTISNTIKIIVQNEEPLLEDEDVDPRELGVLLLKISNGSSEKKILLVMDRWFDKLLKILIGQNLNNVWQI